MNSFQKSSLAVGMPLCMILFAVFGFIDTNRSNRQTGEQAAVSFHGCIDLALDFIGPKKVHSGSLEGYRMTENR